MKDGRADERRKFRLDMSHESLKALVSGRYVMRLNRRPPPWPAASQGTVGQRRLRRLAKRSFDITFALGLLTVAVVPMILIAIAVKLDSSGPVLYRVRRVGYRGRPLLMLKFRKMRHNVSGIPLTAQYDARLTRLGTFLARTRLDELPQLWEVLRGRMSVVGPRPEDPLFVALRARDYDQILAVRPGITGLSQLAFADEHKILDQGNLVEDYVARILPQKVALDVLYSSEHCMRVDLAILRWTVTAIVLRRTVAVNRGTGALSARRPRFGAPLADAPTRGSESVAGVG